MAFEFEEDRQFYLRQLGVTAWYARHQLPGASESYRPRFWQEGNGCVTTKADAKPSLPVPVAFDDNWESPEFLTDSQPPDYPVAGIDSSPQLTEFLTAGDKTASDTSDKSLDGDKRRANSFGDLNAGQRLPDESQILSVRRTRPAADVEQADEIWCRYSWADESLISTTNDSQALANNSVVVAKLSLPNLGTERLLMQNIMKSILPDRDLPGYDEFFWPPFHRKNIPLQNESLKNKLLLRWLDESERSLLMIFSEQAIPGLEDANYYPSLAELILKPQSKHAIWDRLRQLPLTP